MEKETLTIKHHLNKNAKSVNTLIQTFDLRSLIEKMRHKPSWAKEGLDTMILSKSSGKQIVLTILHEGTEIQSFQLNDSITFQIIEGRLKFHTRKESVLLGKGQLLTLKEKIKYTLTTKEETVFLMTIATSKFKEAEKKMSFC